MPDVDAENGLPVELNIYQRMVAAMQRVKYVQKERGQQLKYSITTHDAVTAKCREALIHCGVYAYPEITETVVVNFMAPGVQWENNEKVTVEKAWVAMTVKILMHFVNIDKPDERITVPSIGTGVDQQLNQDKCPGKGISYAVKYAYLKGLGLETGDDPDLEQDRAADEPEEKPKKVPKPRDKKSDIPPPSDEPIHIANARAALNALCLKQSDATNTPISHCRGAVWAEVQQHFEITKMDELTEKTASQLIDWCAEKESEITEAV